VTDGQTPADRKDRTYAQHKNKQYFYFKYKPSNISVLCDTIGREKEQLACKN